MATKIDIGGELNPRTVEGIVADASTIIDRTAEKRQDEINSEVSESLEGKQDVIADLETIRSGAASGSTAIQPTQIEDVVRHVNTGALEPLLDPSDYATTDQLNQLGQTANKFRFGHWNVGHFSYYDGRQGTDTPDIPAADSAAMALLYKKAINEINADVFGVCEDDPVFDADDTASLPLLYEPRFAICEQGTKYNYMCASLYTNLPLKDVRVSQVYYPQTVQANRYYKLMVATFNGHVVKFVETHLDWNQGDYGAEYRAAQIQKLISDFANDDYVVIAGDFNVNPTSEWDAFANAGYEMANHGYIGDLITHVNHISQEQYPLDNIIAKGFRISDIKVYESTFELSDHAAIACDLTMINP